jgi:hypothetical protein
MTNGDPEPLIAFIQGEIARIFGGVKDPGIIVDRIAGAAIGDTETRQGAPETPEVSVRLDLVQEHLATVLAHISDRNASGDRGGDRGN